jgi:hypothetical protein
LTDGSGFFGGVPLLDFARRHIDDLRERSAHLFVAGFWLHHSAPIGAIKGVEESLAVGGLPFQPHCVRRECDAPACVLDPDV